ncbi:MAG: zinc ABC transporter substrate-binding protein [Gordonia sp. (in: high G+C Gram-positive bacteria)]|uniref:metal ABC transporter solute-binding protein, Zn/Mn family n=1 Tax=Gordonia sp. (in: high G+C Gram-positive bacteria) TaxID=84139 RepID=UPI0039E47CD3
MKLHLQSSHLTRTLVATAAALAVTAGAAACSSDTSNSANDGKIVAVAAENEYGDVLSQVGGDHVDVHSIMSNPDTDPHEFEANTDVAKQVSQAKLLVQNGVGYDDFMEKIEQANPSSDRQVINVQKLRGLPDDTPNPHLWYDPETMPAVADEMAKILGDIQPENKAEFTANADKFKVALQPWKDALAQFKQQHPDTPVAVTEPVADYLLKAAGANIRTPETLEAAVMNDTDPSATDVEFQNKLVEDKQVKVLLYNQQVTDDSTTDLLKKAKAAGVPVVGVYETMPEGFTYQDWMLAETKALSDATANGTSTEQLSK